MRPLRNVAFALLALIPVICAAAQTARLEDLTVMALGALDGRAVVKTADGKMQVLKVGDTIPGTQAVLSQVLTDKIIVQDTIVGADKSTKKQTVWISKPAQPGGKSAVQRLDTEAPPSRVIATKVAQPVSLPNASTKTKKTK